MTNFEVSNVFAKQNTVVIVIKLIDSGKKFNLNLSKASFDAMDEDELKIMLENVVEERESSIASDSVKNKMSSLRGYSNVKSS